MQSAPNVLQENILKLHHELASTVDVVQRRRLFKLLAVAYKKSGKLDEAAMKYMELAKSYIADIKAETDSEKREVLQTNRTVAMGEAWTLCEAALAKETNSSQRQVKCFMALIKMGEHNEAMRELSAMGTKLNLKELSPALRAEFIEAVALDVVYNPTIEFNLGNENVNELLAMIREIQDPSLKISIMVRGICHGNCLFNMLKLQTVLVQNSHFSATLVGSNLVGALRVELEKTLGEGVSKLMVFDSGMAKSMREEMNYLASVKASFPVKTFPRIYDLFQRCLPELQPSFVSEGNRFITDKDL